MGAVESGSDVRCSIHAVPNHDIAMEGLDDRRHQRRV